ncbi:MAG: hypothetical protein RIC30_00800 [Marinoscillum sp.]|uniref:hypothetical protein n=1 Tax=Marinoscillum sp. TaxID=2024838 RepID=UPI003304ECA7
MTAEILGYIALGLGIFAMANKHMLWLRVAHGLSAAFYVGYGLMISANPIVVAGVIFLFIHGYHLTRMFLTRKATQ